MTIGIPYTMRFTDPSLPGKTDFTINPNTTDGPLTPTLNSPDSSAKDIHTSLVFPGMGLIQYGERVNKSLLHVLENFASCSSPVAPTIGQNWYDFCNRSMKVWNGTNWDPVGGTGFPIASVVEYNAIAADINKVIGTPIPGIGGTPDTVWGYNQQLLPMLTTNPTDAQWITLVQTVRNVGLHQGTDVVSLVDGSFDIPPFGATIGVIGLIARFVDLQAKVTAIKLNRQMVDVATLTSTSSAGGTSTRTTPWLANLIHTVNVQFVSNAHMLSFFNTGGSLSVSANLDSNSTPQNARWQSFLQAIGTVQLQAFTTQSTNGTIHFGLYNLNGDMQQIYSNNVGGASGDTFAVAASVDTVMYAVTLTMTFTDNGLDGSGVDESITGNITSTVTATKAGAAYIDNPEIAYPVLTTIVPLTVGGNVTTPGNASTCQTVTGSGNLTIPAGSTLVTGYGTGGSGSNGPGTASTATLQGSQISWPGAENGDPNIPASLLQTIANNVGLSDVTLSYSVAAGTSMSICYTGPKCPVPGKILATHCVGQDQYNTVADGNCGTTEALVQRNSPSCCPGAGTVLGQRCAGNDLYHTVADGNCGTQDVLVQHNSPSCCPAAGTVIATHCTGTDQYNTVADGSCGTVEQLVQHNAPSCCPAAGTVITTHCTGTSQYHTVADGNCGTQEVLVQANSPSCCPPAGTVIATHCTGNDLYNTVADGNCGTTEQLVQSNAPGCIHYPPSGTILATHCTGNDSYNTVADGNGGSTEQLVSHNSSSCCTPAGTVLATHCTGTSQFHTVADGNCGTTEVLVQANSPSCCPAAGTVVATHCTGNDKYNTVTDGNCGTTEQLVQSNAPGCCPAAGTVLATPCVGFNRYNTVADGSCGSSNQLSVANDPGCGFTPSSITAPTITIIDLQNGLQQITATPFTASGSVIPNYVNTNILVTDANGNPVATQDANTVIVGNTFDVGALDQAGAFLGLGTYYVQIQYVGDNATSSGWSNKAAFSVTSMFNISPFPTDRLVNITINANGTWTAYQENGTIDLGGSYSELVPYTVTSGSITVGGRTDFDVLFSAGNQSTHTTPDITFGTWFQIPGSLLFYDGSGTLHFRGHNQNSDTVSMSWVLNAVPYYYDPGTCFPAGNMVTMADGTTKAIETVVPGDMAMGPLGPVVIDSVDRPILGNRKMKSFADGSLLWSEEHGMWTKVGDKQWWWSANAAMWTNEVDTGQIGGLLDNSTMRTGTDGVSWAHVDGWKVSEVQDAAGYEPSTPLYLPRTSGSPIIVNGYLVGAGIDEKGFDYTKIDWDTDRLKLVPKAS